LVSGKKGIEAMIHAIKHGYHLLDTAELYGNEREVGEAVRLCGLPREKNFVVSKLFSTSGGRKAAIESVEDSLKKMDIGYIDQYLLHAPQGGRVLECYDVFLEYQKKGLIKTVGVSNFGVEHLEAMKNSGRPLPQVNQIELHPWCTQEAIVDWCKKNGVVVVGYSPLTQTKHFDDEIVKELTEKYSKTPAQILIRYSIQKEFVTIPKTIRPERIEENSNVFDFSLIQEEMDRFDEIGRKIVSRCCWNPTQNDIVSEFGPTK
jgi:diketogulonate reductase-like aldo/keto reductase